MAETVELYFDGILKTCTITEDSNGEYVCESEDGNFTKFPKGSDFDAEVERYNAANDKEVEVIPDVVYGEVELTANRQSDTA